MTEFNPLTYQPGTYPDSTYNTRYNAAYALVWGWELGADMNLMHADVAAFAEKWASTPYAERPPLHVAFGSVLRGMRSPEGAPIWMAEFRRAGGFSGESDDNVH